jgi:hypothetical protein
VFEAIGTGTVSWRLRAVSESIPDSSAVIETDPVIIQAAPGNIMVQLISSIPTAVIRGQSHVFPLSIKYRHPDTSSTAAPLRLDSLRLKVEDESGLAQAANSVFSGMFLATQYTNLAIVESVTPESNVLLIFDEPAILLPGEEQLLSLRVDIDSLAGAGTFALSLENSSSMIFVDDNNDQPVPIDPTVVFPLKTLSCRIDNQSQNIAVSYLPILNEYANYGQESVDVLKLILRHPGKEDNSQVQLTGLSFEFVNQAGDPVIASELFDEIKLLKEKIIIAELTSFESGASHLTTMLSAPTVISPGQIDTVKFQVSIKHKSAYSSFGVSISDSTCFLFRDLNSGAKLVAKSDTSSLVSGEIFPIFSGITRLKSPASAPEMCVTSKLPVSIIAGSDSIALVEVRLDYPAGYDCSSIRLTSVLISVQDTLGRPLDPYQLFDRVGFRAFDGPVNYQSFVDLQDGFIVFHMDPEGITIDPGDNATVQLVADIEAEAPFDHFVLRIYAENSLRLVDATDTTSDPGFVISTDCSDTLPFASNVVRILLPAGRPIIKADLLPTQIGFPSQTGLNFFSGELRYDSPKPQGDLVMKSWHGRTLRCSPEGLVPIAANQVFKTIHLLSDDQLIASDSALVGDSLLLELDEEYVLSHGESKTIRLTCDVKPYAQLGNYVVRFGDSTFIEFLDHNLMSTIYPGLQSGNYPLMTAEISLVSNSLKNSFTNYPNPFNPAQGEFTTIAFVLTQGAHVDIEVFTITGELVKKMVDNSYRPAGSYQQDTWSGTNASGLMVVPGTYFCRITARYSSGQVESVRRKVAVLR